jgi:hypothetical protein
MIWIFDGLEKRQGAHCPKRSLRTPGLINASIGAKKGWCCLLGGQYTPNRMAQHHSTFADV